MAIVSFARYITRIEAKKSTVGVWDCGEETFRSTTVVALNH